MILSCYFRVVKCMSQKSTTVTGPSGIYTQGIWAPRAHVLCISPQCISTWLIQGLTAEAVPVCRKSACRREGGAGVEASRWLPGRSILEGLGALGPGGVRMILEKTLKPISRIVWWDELRFKSEWKHACQMLLPSTLAASQEALRFYSWFQWLLGAGLEPWGPLCSPKLMNSRLVGGRRRILLS